MNKVLLLHSTILNIVNQNATIGKLSGVMSHLLNKDYQIHHIDQMHHIGLIDHILHIDTISRILIVYTLVIAQIEFL